MELLKESPSPALRSCWATAQTYPPLARDLFNAAFVSCWSELHEEQQVSDFWVVSCMSSMELHCICGRSFRLTTVFTGERHLS